jgi:hypothetical protein
MADVHSKEIRSKNKCSAVMYEPHQWQEYKA